MTGIKACAQQSGSTRYTQIHFRLREVSGTDNVSLNYGFLQYYMTAEYCYSLPFCLCRL